MVCVGQYFFSSRGKYFSLPREFIFAEIMKVAADGYVYVDRACCGVDCGQKRLVHQAVAIPVLGVVRGFGQIGGIAHKPA